MKLSLKTTTSQPFFESLVEHDDHCWHDKEQLMHTCREAISGLLLGSESPIMTPNVMSQGIFLVAVHPESL